MSGLKGFWGLVTATAKKWREDNISWLAAALAYYTLFSLAPTFIVVVYLGGKIFGEEAVKGQIVVQLQELVGYNTAVTVQKMIESGQSLLSGTVPNLFTIGIMLYAATNVFTHLIDTLNMIWKAPPGNRHWVAEMILGRIISFALVLSIGILLLGLVLLNIVLSVFGRLLAEFVPAFTHVYIWHIANFIVSFILISLLFAVIYKILPEVPVAWRDVFPGAILASFLFTMGKSLIALYLGKSRMLSLFGAASSFVVLLIWVYYSVQILFLGAAFSYCYARQYGSRPGGAGTAAGG
ncbi:MAG: YihY/virulence factor BrkB family protein [Calditrichaeota bacterium]|nr:MAG: YihY/virulence factor BrkB family protein [Calditrichota bacterium]